MTNPARDSGGAGRLPELVLSLPESLGLQIGAEFGARTTTGVIVQLIAEAQARILIGAPYIDESAALLEGPIGLAIRAAMNRRVGIALVTADQTLGREHFPQLRKFGRDLFRVYTPTGPVDGGDSYFTHAKFCISDIGGAYIGSANFTYSGIHRNLEMGVVLRGEPVRLMLDFFEFLFRHQLLVEVP